ncbi:serine phosphatase rsbu, regulator of sigma subunit [hydrocarbon metagenome]|uniref:Serine phosphatase rsbu, regulator of sigma subunit n=1 Tax=hydrocarbon metagenome TaxID=938273 RepID=A0A0W8G048_9ZZZZ
MAQKEEPKIRHTIRDDLRQPDLRKTLSDDYRELKENFLDDEKKDQLRDMSPVRRFFKISWWLLRAMFFRMTPVRRLLFVLGILLIFMTNFQFETGGVSSSSNSHILGGFILVFVLMLELKDKLLAKDELEAGHKVQSALMPESNPHIEGWNVWLFTTSANDVGGDLIDYLQLSENKYGISIGDVAGKGLSAALIMAKLQATIRALADVNVSLTELISKINKIFHRDSLKSIFASLLYLEIFENENKVKFINAGHMPPVIVKKDSIEPLKKGGPALGLLKELELPEEMIIMQSGEKFIVYSDGVTEAVDENGVFFGDTRFMKILENQRHRPAKDLGTYIFKTIEDYRGNAKMNDDLSIVIIEKL